MSPCMPQRVLRRSSGAAEVSRIVMEGLAPAQVARERAAAPKPRRNIRTPHTPSAPRRRPHETNRRKKSAGLLAPALSGPCVLAIWH
ncbi:hypothetical protein PT2222_40216 [Paraburkholderia tropica]